MSEQTVQNVESLYREFPSIYDLFGLPDFPYPCKISLAPVIRAWEQQVERPDPSGSFMAREIVRRLENAPELREPIDSLDTLRRHYLLVDLMLSGFFPSLMENKVIGGLSGPFNTQPFYQSSSLRQLSEETEAEFFFQQDAGQVFPLIITQAGNIILNKYYNTPLLYPPMNTFLIRFPNSPIERHFQTELFTDFTEIKLKGSLPALDAEQISELMNNLGNADLWLERLPPSIFEFQGVVYTGITEVTRSETISQLKRSLLDRNALLSTKKFRNLYRYLCTLFQNPGLQVGVTVADYPESGYSAGRYRLGHGLLSGVFPNLLAPELGASAYLRACEEGDTVIVNSLSALPEKTPLEQALQERGFESVCITPLYSSKKKVIGFLELASAREGDFDQLSRIRIQDVAGLFNIAVQRSREEVDNQIDAIIRNEFTSLHPSLEWRFEESAYRIFEQRERGLEKAEFQPIVFQDVYPLYGQADIVGSSGVRNNAIQMDLMENFCQARRVLEIAGRNCEFPLRGQIASELDEQLASVKEGITSSNEYSAIEFIQSEVHPLFEELRHRKKAIAEAVERYYSSLDPALNMVYKKRKDYEDSVSAINSMISEYLEKEQRKAQAMIPHFYEKYQTDGIAYNIYVGQSILQKGAFNHVHLSNLRLWQLITMCEITRKVAAIQEQVAVPLTTAQLILVHSSPLSIRFRMDEKRFDVDGAYNARYEIVKKRIDKAYIESEGNKERLTLSGKIAIAYQQDEDRLEYLRYLHFLAKEGYIKEGVEELQLQKLQGIQGLRALRVEVRV